MEGAARITEKPPPLQPGDHLDVVEFERRYRAMPEVKKAELIEGVVFMPSPVSAEHGEQHFNLIGWLWYYRLHTPVVSGGDNVTLRLPVGMNRPQPDACLRIKDEYGGQAKLDKDGYIQGAPELVAEVAASSASYDLYEKFDAYQCNGVKEYVVWCIEDETISWFSLRGDKYQPLRLKDGLYRSKVFPGLWLEPAALIAGDLARVLQQLQAGIASPEHGRFVAKLQRRAGR